MSLSEKSTFDLDRRLFFLFFFLILFLLLGNSVAKQLLPSVVLIIIIVPIFVPLPPLIIYIILQLILYMYFNSYQLSTSITRELHPFNIRSRENYIRSIFVTFPPLIIVADRGYDIRPASTSITRELIAVKIFVPLPLLRSRERYRYPPFSFFRSESVISLITPPFRDHDFPKL